VNNPAKPRHHWLGSLRLKNRQIGCERETIENNHSSQRAQHSRDANKKANRYWFGLLDTLTASGLPTAQKSTKACPCADSAATQNASKSAPPAPTTADELPAPVEQPGI
jgi:hypothetical protein